MTCPLVLAQFRILRFAASKESKGIVKTSSRHKIPGTPEDPKQFKNILDYMVDVGQLDCTKVAQCYVYTITELGRSDLELMRRVSE